MGDLAMRHSPTGAFLLGLWLGGSIVLVAVVGYNFAGIDTSFDVNPKLAERAGFAPEDEAAKKTSVIWVFASELNRAFFHAWNRCQLALGGLAFLVLAIRLPRRTTLLCVTLALAIAAILTFYLEPRIIEIGRSLDFVPRDPPPGDLAEFYTLHKAYTGLAFAQMVLVLITFLCVVPGKRLADKKSP